VVLRLHANDEPVLAWRFALAARCCGCVATISADPAHAVWLEELVRERDIDVVCEDQARLIARLPTLCPARLRSATQVDERVLRAAHAQGCDVLVGPLLANGRHELRAWLREQAVSLRYHRYGNPALGPARLAGLASSRPPGCV